MPPKGKPAPTVKKPSGTTAKVPISNKAPIKPAAKKGPGKHYTNFKFTSEKQFFGNYLIHDIE